jgi:hypothetical protein
MAIVRRVASEQDGVVTRAQVGRAGLSRHDVESLLRAGRWRRLARSAYLIDAEVGMPAPRRARIRAAVASYGPGAVAALGTAAELHGIAGLRRTEKVHLSVPSAAARAVRPGDPDVVVHQFVLPPGSADRRVGIPATTPLRTVADLVLTVDRFVAVSLLDSALNLCLIDLGDIARIPALIRGRRGAVAARRFLAEADGRAQSPLETRTRLRCVDGRVPPEALQVDVRDEDGYLLGVGDLGWLAAKVIAEADGSGPHGTPEAVFADRRRQNLFVNAGWTVLRFTWADTLRPDYIPYVVRRALVRAHRS